MRPEIFQESLEAAGHAANCAVAVLVQEHPVAVLRRRRVEVATDHTVGEGGHMRITVAFTVV
jgi:16S rRNA C1402 N4-methylase RsmH